MAQGSSSGDEGGPPIDLTRSTRRRVTVVALGVIAVVLTTLGCGGSSATKAGKTSDPVVLRLANGYTDLSYEPAVAYFVQRVHDLSGGALKVDAVGDWGISDRPSFEQRIVKDVASGEADLGWVGTRIFDTLGVRSFQALTAPMLIDSYPLEQAVIDSGIPAEMLESLDQLDVTGLAVLADGLRKPIAVKQPLLGPADWRGVTFAAFRSRGQAAAIRALGASPSDLWGPPLNDGLVTGSVQGFEKNLLVYQINGMQDAARYVTANVNLWPQTVALLASPQRLSALSAEQQTWLRRAAEDAAAHSTDLVDHDARTAVSACRQGARLANASEADLAALRRAFAPVATALERDPQTKAFMVRIERLKRSTPPGPVLAIPPGCTASTRSTSVPSTTAASTDPSVLNGAYRVEWTEQELLAGGTSGRYARSERGIVTMTMRDGRFVWHEPPWPDCGGAYAMSGHTVSITFTVHCDGVLTARWSLGNGQLRLRVLRTTDTGDKVFFGSKPWKKLG